MIAPALSVRATLARVTDPEQRLQRLLTALWRELPRESNGFANNVMQALSTTSRGDEYSPHLRRRFQARVAQWLRSCLTLDAGEASHLAAVLLMAFDGYVMNAHVGKGVACDAATLRLTCRLLSGHGS
jgi:hypothetical protein